MAKKPKPQGAPISLNPSQTSITTASVTIKTLRVDNRQLTQAVFRQLPLGELVDIEKITLSGPIWGWVNYQPDGDSENRQFVQQLGDKLCRSPFRVHDILELDPGRVWPSPFTKLHAAYQRAAEDWILARAIQGKLDFDPVYVDPWGHQHRDQTKLVLTVHEHLKFWKFYVTIGGGPELNHRMLHAFQESVYPHAALRYRMKRTGDRRDAAEYKKALADPDLKEQTARYRDDISKLLATRTKEMDNPPAKFLALMDDIALEAVSYIKRWNALMEQLRQIEQLYIAV